MATGRVPTTANSPLTTKGDLFGYSTAPARLAVGSDGDTIVADNSTSTGLRWQGSQAAGKNAIINGGMDIWQRGTSAAGGVATPGSGYLADRWQNYRAVAGSTFSRQTTSDTTNLPNIQYCMRIQRDLGNTNTTTIYFGSNIEISQAYPFVGKTITISFYARAGANYSATSSFLNAAVVTGTNSTDTNGFLGGYTGQVTAISQNATLTTTWQRFSYTGTLNSNITQFYLAFNHTPTGTAGAADYCEITGVQVEVGSVATNFTRAGGTIQGELAACQRYYTTWNSPVGTTDAGIGTGFASSTTSARIYIPLPVRMRTTPTTVDWTASGLALNEITAGYTVSSLVFQGAVNNPQTVCVTATVASGLTQWRPYFFNVQSSTSFGIGAEL